MRDVDKIVQIITQEYPNISVEQLKVRFPGNDDDGIWTFGQPESVFLVQLESWNGMCPFLIETHENSERFTAHSIGEALEVLRQLLHLQHQMGRPGMRPS